MSLSSSIRVLQAYVELGLRDSALRKGLTAASRHLATFGSRITSLGTRLAGLGAAASAGLFAAAKSYASTGAALADLAKRTGLSTDALSELTYAAQQTGTSQSTLETSLRKMAQLLDGAANSAPDAVEALAKLGLTYAQLSKLSPDEQFAALGEAISRIPDPMARAAAAMRIFGKSGTELLPMFAQGAAGITALRQAAAARGLTVSAEEAAAAHAFDDALTDLWTTARRTVVTLGSALAPALKTVAAVLTQIAVAATTWIQNNQQLVSILALGAPAAIALGTALVGLGQAFRVASAAAALTSAAIAGTAATIKLLAAAIAVLSSSPIAIFATLAAIAVATSAETTKALTTVAHSFIQIKDTALTAWKGISAALRAGDLALAAEIAFEGLRLALAQALAGIKDAWRGVSNFLLATWDKTVATLAKLFLSLPTHIANGLDAIRTKFSEVLITIRTAFAHTVAFLKTIWYKLLWIIKPGASRLGMERTKQELQQQLAALEAERSQLKNDAAARAEQRRKALHDAIAEIDRATEARIARRDATRAAKRAADQAKIDEQRKRLADKVAQAEAAAEAADQPPPELNVPKIPDFDPDAIAAGLDPDAIAAGLDRAAARHESIGTFSPWEIAGLGTRSLAERTALATERIAEDTDQLVRSAKNNPLVFA